MTHKNMFTPTSELMQEWLTKWRDKRATVPYDEFFAAQAAQWGADQELDDCCEWISMHTTWDANRLRTARRSKPPSLKEQSIALIDKIQGNKEMWDIRDLDVIRQALESLPD